MGQAEAPRRVTVTSPHTRTTARGTRRYPVTQDIDEQTRLGEVYMRTLMYAQLRLAVQVCGVVGLLLGGLPLLFALAPSLRAVRVLGLGLQWLLLGVLAYPTLFAGGWFYVRQSERNERDFADLVERS